MTFVEIVVVKMEEKRKCQICKTTEEVESTEDGLLCILCLENDPELLESLRRSAGMIK